MPSVIFNKKGAAPLYGKPPTVKKGEKRHSCQKIPKNF